MATYLKYENGIVVPEGKEYPPVQLLFKSASEHLKAHRMLNRKKKDSGSIVAYAIIIGVAVAVNALLTLAVAVQ